MQGYKILSLEETLFVQVQDGYFYIKFIIGGRMHIIIISFREYFRIHDAWMIFCIYGCFQVWVEGGRWMDHFVFI